MLLVNADKRNFSLKVCVYGAATKICKTYWGAYQMWLQL